MDLGGKGLRSEALYWAVSTDERALRRVCSRLLNFFLYGHHLAPTEYQHSVRHSVAWRGIRMYRQPQRLLISPELITSGEAIGHAVHVSRGTNAQDRQILYSQMPARPQTNVQQCSLCYIDPADSRVSATVQYQHSCRGGREDKYGVRDSMVGHAEFMLSYRACQTQNLTRQSITVCLAPCQIASSAEKLRNAYIAPKLTGSGCNRGRNGESHLVRLRITLRYVALLRITLKRRRSTQPPLPPPVLLKLQVSPSGPYSQRISVYKCIASNCSRESRQADPIETRIFSCHVPSSDRY